MAKFNRGSYQYMEKDFLKFILLILANFICFAILYYLNLSIKEKLDLSLKLNNYFVSLNSLKETYLLIDSYPIVDFLSNMSSSWSKVSVSFHLKRNTHHLVPDTVFKDFIEKIVNFLDDLTDVLPELN